MMTEREKKIGIVMLVIAVIVLLVIIVVRVDTAKKTGGIHGSGVSDGERSDVVRAAQEFSGPFYAQNTDGATRYCSLSQASMLDVYMAGAMEAEGALAIAERIEEDHAQEQIEQQAVEPANLHELAGQMSDEVFSSYRVMLENAGDFDSDSVSFTSLFVKPWDVLSYGTLYSAGYEVPEDKVRILGYGCTESNNSIERLYNDVIRSSYKPGTYFALRMTEGTIDVLGGDTALVALFDNEITTKQVSDWVAAGLSADDLLASGDLNLICPPEDESSEATEYENIYEKYGLTYDWYFVDMLDATEEMLVVHVLGNRVCVERYAVGNAYGQVFDEMSAYDENMDEDYTDAGESIIEEVVEQSGFVVADSETAEVLDAADESVDDVVEQSEPVISGDMEPVFTGYYCW